MAITSLERAGRAHHVLEGEEPAQAAGGGTVYVGRAQLRRPVPEAKDASLPDEYQIDDPVHNGCTSPFARAAVTAFALHGESIPRDVSKKTPA